MKIKRFIAPLLLTCSMIGLIGCSSNDDDVNEEVTNSKTYIITVEAYTLSDGIYTSTGKELIFDSKEECQTWSRTAPGDNHDSNTHLHYNAAANVAYSESSNTFQWTEYGPEVDQTSIENTCSAGIGGVTKVVTDHSYFQDKPNLYLKISNVVEK